MTATRSSTAYAGLADVWDADAALAYDPLARHLVAAVPDDLAANLDGALALDAGAGSGVAGRALRERGARVVSADREPDMAAYLADAGPAVTADVTRLPFRDGTFDAVAAAFVVNHLPDPVAGFRELRRVTRPGGVVLASAFSSERAAAKNAVDEVAAGHGFVRPGWYADLQVFAEAVGAPGAVEEALAMAGFDRWTVTEEAVDVGLDTADAVVRYRLGMPHLHAFAASLGESERAAFVGEAVRAVERSGAVFAPRVVEAVAIA